MGLFIPDMDKICPTVQVLKRWTTQTYGVPETTFSYLGVLETFISVKII
jgi:hypothetical protein